HPGRNGAAPPPVGVRDLADVDVAARIDGEAVRRDELAELEPGGTIAEAREHLALRRVDADARPDVRQLLVHRHAAARLADVEARLGTAMQVEAGRAMHVVPLRFVLAVAVEHLDAMVLAV